MTLAVTDQGLTIDSLQEIKDNLGAAIQANVDPLINTDADSIDGGDIGVSASAEAEVQEVIQILADALNPDNAEGERLEVIAAITGTIKNPATFSTFGGSNKLIVAMAPGKVLPGDGTAKASVLGHPEFQFAITQAADNSAGVVQANFDVSAVCTTPGPVHANAGTLTVRATSVDGWVSVTNPNDAELGQDVESDPALRTRREIELRKAGTSTDPSIEAALIAMVDENQIHPIKSVHVLDNRTDVLSNDAVLPRTIEVVIWDGVSSDADNTQVGQTIYDHLAEGTPTQGQWLVDLTLPNGDFFRVFFTRATQRRIHIAVSIFVDSATYIGDAAVQQNLSDAIAASESKVGGRLPFSRYMAKLSGYAGVEAIENWTWNFEGHGPVTFADLILGSRDVGIVNDAATDIVVTLFPIII